MTDVMDKKRSAVADTESKINAYKAEIKCIDTDDEECWEVTYPELPGCVAFGASAEQAFKRARHIATIWLKRAGEREGPIPTPGGGTPSFEAVKIRVPPVVRVQLDDLVANRNQDMAAGERKLSLTEVVNELLRAELSHVGFDSLKIGNDQRSVMADRALKFEAEACKHIASATHIDQKRIITANGAWAQRIPTDIHFDLLDYASAQNLKPSRAAAHLLLRAVTRLEQLGATSKVPPERPRSHGDGGKHAGRRKVGLHR